METLKLLVVIFAVVSDFGIRENVILYLEGVNFRAICTYYALPTF